MRSTVLCRSFLALLLCAAASYAAEKSTPEEVEGTWKLTGYVEDGKAKPEEVKADYLVTRKAGVQEITKGGEIFTTRRYEVDVKNSPKTIDFISDAGRTLAVYEIKDKMMRVAMYLDPAKLKSERPSDFEEAGKVVATYERVAKEPATDGRDEVYEYLKANVIGKSVSFSSVSANSDDTLEFDFKRTLRYRNLVKTERGLAFDVFGLIKQTNYDLQDGKRLMGKPGVNKDRELLVRYEFRQSESTGILIGMSDTISNTMVDSIGSGAAVTLKLEGDSLTLREVTPLFADHFAAGDTYKPGRSEVVGTFTTQNGKLKLVEKYTSYYVNPDTLEKTSPVSEKEQINEQLE